jgi:hypothetical protein
VSTTWAGVSDGGGPAAGGHGAVVVPTATTAAKASAAGGSLPGQPTDYGWSWNVDHVAAIGIYVRLTGREPRTLRHHNGAAGLGTTCGNQLDRSGAPTSHVALRPGYGGDSTGRDVYTTSSP